MRIRKNSGLVFALILISILVVTVPTVFAGDGISSGTPEANGPLTYFTSYSGRYDYVAAGVGMRNKGYGNITISGIPSGSSIVAAYLYWDILDDEELPSFDDGTFDGMSITGTLIGTDLDPCWSPQTTNYAYRADVTSLVSGNGIYSLTGFASGDTDGSDPFTKKTPPLLEGASLVVIYYNPTLPWRTIIIWDGATYFTAAKVSTTITGFTAKAPVSAKTSYIVADGQDNNPNLNNKVYFNTVCLATERLKGFEGWFWDTETYDVSTYVSDGDTSVTAEIESASDDGAWDCLVWVAQVFSVTTPPPEYTLTIYSSPTGVMFTVDAIPHTTPWSGTYIDGTSVSLEMPETHNGYVWSHWLEDGDPNRAKTVTMNTNITLTGVFTPAPPPPVGGKATPINVPMIKPELQIPWMWLSTIILSMVAIMVFVKKKKKK